MSATLAILRAGPLTTIQDEGRFGMLRHGISASGPMDANSFGQAGQGGCGGIEFTLTGIEFRVASGTCRIGFAGGSFKLKINGKRSDWPSTTELQAGDLVAITPGSAGNYGYLRFGTDMAIEPVLRSMSTSSRARIGGLDGRSLHAGDVVQLGEQCTDQPRPIRKQDNEGPMRTVWGLHADAFDPLVRQRFLQSSLVISTRMDRMGVRLDDPDGVFAGSTRLSLVSDAIVPGDIQILGDGTPIVLMRDHQPTGGYPRIATIISADLDRFAQIRPGSTIAFMPVTVEHAQQLLRSRL
jgi:allophanate hydrolase